MASRPANQEARGPAYTQHANTDGSVISCGCYFTDNCLCTCSCPVLYGHTRRTSITCETGFRSNPHCVGEIEYFAIYFSNGIHSTIHKIQKYHSTNQAICYHAALIFWMVPITGSLGVSIFLMPKDDLGTCLRLNSWAWSNYSCMHSCIHDKWLYCK